MQQGRPLCLLLALAAGVCWLSGCSGSGAPRPSPGQVRSEIEIDGIDSVEDQALQAVMKAPLEFTVSFDEDQHAWDRARLFLRQYTLRGVVVDQELPYGEGKLSNVIQSKNALGDFRPEPYLYTIERRLTTEGFRYLVQCQVGDSRGDPMYANRNGRNLARFVQAGSLELSLLVR
jgi:hypothetical protein